MSKEVLEPFDEAWDALKIAGRCTARGTPEYERVKADWEKRWDQSFKQQLSDFIELRQLRTFRESWSAAHVALERSKPQTSKHA